MSRLTRDGTAEPVSRDQILRHARGQGNIIFPVQLTTSRIGNLTRLIHTLLYVMTIHTYIHLPSTTILRFLACVCVCACVLFIKLHITAQSDPVKVCVCVFFPFILDVRLVDVPARVTQEEGHTEGKSHRIFHPPSFCGACLYFSREKDSAVPLLRRPRSRT